MGVRASGALNEFTDAQLPEYSASRRPLGAPPSAPPSTSPSQSRTIDGNTAP